MGKSEKENLTTILHKNLEGMQEAFQVLESEPRSSLEKVDWEEVINIAEQLSKKATVAGLRWIGEAPDCEELEENMGIYFSMLQEFLLLAHRSKIGSGPTLADFIQESAKRFAHSSYSFFKEAVSCFGTLNEDRKLSIQQLADSVGEACALILKTIPTTNHAAIARETTWVAKSMEGALRQLKNLKPASSENPTNANTTDELTTGLNKNYDDDDDDVDNGSFESGENGNDISPEEMKMAESAIIVLSDTLTVIKELVIFITGLGRHSKPSNNDGKSVRLLELLFERCRKIKRCIYEVGVDLYPPQEVTALKLGIDDTSDEIRKLQEDVRQFEDASCDSFLQACECALSSLRNMKTELDSLEPILVASEMHICELCCVRHWH
ncbi:hypothetical protein MKW92_036445 [Papaver armeniacum]|nr:hypothetical protein MKW92_036445 [Papaver armeniacum]